MSYNDLRASFEGKFKAFADANDLIYRFENGNLRKGAQVYPDSAKPPLFLRFIIRPTITDSPELGYQNPRFRINGFVVISIFAKKDNGGHSAAFKTLDLVNAEFEDRKFDTITVREAQVSVNEQNDVYYQLTVSYPIYMEIQK